MLQQIFCISNLNFHQVTLSLPVVSQNPTKCMSDEHIGAQADPDTDVFDNVEMVENFLHLQKVTHIQQSIEKQAQNAWWCEGEKWAIEMLPHIKIKPARHKTKN